MLPRVGVVIGTFERVPELRVTLEAILESSHLPQAIVVVDSSRESIASQNKALCHELNDTGVRIHYLVCDVRSLTFQRNRGLDFLRHQELEYIQVLDDDTYPSRTLIAEQVSLLETKPLAVGVSGRAPNPEAKDRSKLLRLPFVLTGLDSFRTGVVSQGGVGIPVSGSQKGTIKVEWLIGCSMWRGSVFNQVRYEESLRGSCLFEDVDFSVRASRLGQLYVLPQSILNHSMSVTNRPDLELFYYRFSRNRWFVLRSLSRGSFKYLTFGASVLFVALYLVMKSASHPELSRDYLRAVRSTFAGFFDGLSGAQPR